MSLNPFDYCIETHITPHILATLESDLGADPSCLLERAQSVADNEFLYWGIQPTKRLRERVVDEALDLLI